MRRRLVPYVTHYQPGFVKHGRKLCADSGVGALRAQAHAGPDSSAGTVCARACRGGAKTSEDAGALEPVCRECPVLTQQNLQRARQIRAKLIEQSTTLPLREAQRPRGGVNEAARGLVRVTQQTLPQRE